MSPDLAAQLAADLRAMRSGHGPGRGEMRERLAMVDEGLRRERNIEALRYADRAARLHAGRGDPKALKAEFEASAARLADFDRRIVAAMIDAKPDATDHRQHIATGSNLPDPAAVAWARSVMRARLQVGAAVLTELLPVGAARQLQTAISRALKRLS
jgi:hypothetical protein